MKLHSPVRTHAKKRSPLLHATAPPPAPPHVATVAQSVRDQKLAELPAKIPKEDRGQLWSKIPTDNRVAVAQAWNTLTGRTPSFRDADDGPRMTFEPSAKDPSTLTVGTSTWANVVNTGLWKGRRHEVVNAQEDGTFQLIDA